MQGDYPTRFTNPPQRPTDEQDSSEGVTPPTESTIKSATSDFVAVGRLDRILFGIEKREIVSALKDASGQRSLAARSLGISRSRLYRRMEALGIDPETLDSSSELL